VQGSLSYEERLRQARDSLRLEKAAHAATRAKLLECEAELAQVKGLGGSPMSVHAEMGGPSDPLHGDIHMSPVAGNASGAKGAVPADVPPDAVVEEDVQSAEQTQSAHVDTEEQQWPRPDARTSPVVGQKPEGDGNVGDDVEDLPMRDDAEVDLEGTQSAGPVPEGGQASHAAQMDPSPAGEDDGTGMFKAGDDAPDEGVHDELVTPAQAAGSGDAAEAEGGVAADEPVGGEGPGGRPSSNLAQCVKLRARRRKVAPVRLSPYTSPTWRRYSRRHGRGGVSTEGTRGGVPDVPTADPATPESDEVLDVEPIAAGPVHMKTMLSSSQEAPPEVREAAKNM